MTQSFNRTLRSTLRQCITICEVLCPLILAQISLGISTSVLVFPFHEYIECIVFIFILCCTVCTLLQYVLHVYFFFIQLEWQHLKRATFTIFSHDLIDFLAHFPQTNHLHASLQNRNQSKLVLAGLYSSMPSLNLVNKQKDQNMHFLFDVCFNISLSFSIQLRIKGVAEVRRERCYLLTYIAMKIAEIPAYYTETHDQRLLSQV